MTARPAKRSLTIAGHKTSLTLEPAFWEALKDVAQSRAQSIAALVAEIDAGRSPGIEGLSSCVRVFLLNHFRAAARGAAS